MSFDDDPDFFKMIEAMMNQLENMPGPIGDMVRQIKSQLENMDPDKLEEFAKNLMSGQPTPIDFSQFMNGSFNPFEMAANPDFAAKIQDFFKNNANININVHVQPLYQDAYFEIFQEDEEHMYVVVELPGLFDIRDVDWTVDEGVISLSTHNQEGQKYKAEVNINREIKTMDALASLNNGVLTIPFKYI